MNSLNRTPILPQQTTQGSQAPQQTSVIINDSNLWANIPAGIKRACSMGCKWSKLKPPFML